MADLAWKDVDASFKDAAALFGTAGELQSQSLSDIGNTFTKLREQAINEEQFRAKQQYEYDKLEEARRAALALEAYQQDQLAFDYEKLAEAKRAAQATEEYNKGYLGYLGNQLSENRRHNQETEKYNLANLENQRYTSDQALLGDVMRAETENRRLDLQQANDIVNNRNNTQRQQNLNAAAQRDQETYARQKSILDDTQKASGLNNSIWNLASLLQTNQAIDTSTEEGKLLQNKTQVRIKDLEERLKEKEGLTDLEIEAVRRNFADPHALHAAATNIAFSKYPNMSPKDVYIHPTWKQSMDKQEAGLNAANAGKVASAAEIGKAEGAFKSSPPSWMMKKWKEINNIRTEGPDAFSSRELGEVNKLFQMITDKYKDLTMQQADRILHYIIPGNQGFWDSVANFIKGSHRNQYPNGVEGLLQYLGMKIKAPQQLTSRDQQLINAGSQRAQAQLRGEPEEKVTQAGARAMSNSLLTEEIANRQGAKIGLLPKNRNETIMENDWINNAIAPDQNNTPVSEILKQTYFYLEPDPTKRKISFTPNEPITIKQLYELYKFMPGVVEQLYNKYGNSFSKSFRNELEMRDFINSGRLY